MDLRNRQGSLIGLVLVAGAALLVWLALSGEPENAPVPPTTILQPPTPSERARPQNNADHAAPEDPRSSPSGILLGRVIDALTRKPIREFKVEFHQAQGTSWRKDTPTGRDFRTKDGRFVWKQAPTGIWMITVSASGYQRFEIGRVRIDGDEATMEFVMPLRKGLVVRGRVFDQSSGAAIAAASISFREADVATFEGNFRARPRTLTHNDGSFSLDGVPPGRIALEVSAQGYSSRQLDITASEMTPILEIALATGGSISGRLVAQDGMTAVPGWASLFDLDKHYGGNGRTNELGGFEFTQLSAGRYRLAGQAQGMTAARDVVLSDGQHLEVTLELATGRTIRGTVSGLSPAELSQVRIDLIRPDGPHEFTLAEPKVDSQGAFELHGLREGRAIVEAKTPKRVMRKTVDIPPDADVVVDLRFESGFALRGRVTRGGKPLADLGVELFARTEDGFPSFTVATAQDGRYSFEGVPRGKYSILAGAHENRTILVSDDAELDIDIPTMELSGEIFDAQGKAPVVRARVSLWSVPSSPRPVRRVGQSDHFGRFSFGSLDAGS